jgi:hypothetical protein
MLGVHIFFYLSHSDRSRFAKLNSAIRPCRPVSSSLVPSARESLLKGERLSTVDLHVLSKQLGFK